jgi:hypothetical protein
MAWGWADHVDHQRVEKCKRAVNLDAGKLSAFHHRGGKVSRTQPFSPYNHGWKVARVVGIEWSGSCRIFAPEMMHGWKMALNQ